jgi:hypothetical protein
MGWTTDDLATARSVMDLRLTMGDGPRDSREAQLGEDRYVVIVGGETLQQL